VEHVGVPDDERSQEPITQVNTVVVIEVLPDKFRFKGTVVIVSVHLRSHWLFKRRVEPAHDNSAEVRSLLHHENNKAHVDEGEHHVHAVDSLGPFAHPVFGVRFQVTECDEEHDNRVDASPHVSRNHKVPLSWVSWSVFEIARITEESGAPDKGEGKQKHCLNMIVNIRYEGLHFPLGQTPDSRWRTFY